MRSKKQIQASRANGARSRGPVTKEGKQRSSQNALRHGLLAKCVVLSNESRPLFHDTFQDYINRFQPVDEIEFNFVEEMAVNYWRLRRAWSIETKMFDERIATMKTGNDAMASIARSMEDLAGAQTLTLLNRYETRIHCAFQRALRNLLLLRNHQEPNEPKDPAPNASNPKPDPQQPPASEQDPPILYPEQQPPDVVPPFKEPKPHAANAPSLSSKEQPPDVVQPFEAAAGFPAGVAPPTPQPAQQRSPRIPNEPKPPAAPKLSNLKTSSKQPQRAVKQTPPDVVQPFEAAAGLPAGVPPPTSQPAQQRSPRIPNEPKPPASTNTPCPSPKEPRPDVVQPFEAAAGLPAGVVPPTPQPAQQRSPRIPNEPKPPASTNKPGPSPKEPRPDVVQPFEAAAGLPAGVAPPISQPAQQCSPRIPNEPKPAAAEPSSSEDLSPDPEEPPYEFVTVFL